MTMKIAKLFCIATLVCAAAIAANERVSLFDGKTLTGWTVLTCEATVDNGEIFLKAGNGMVQTEQKYGDFIFECEFKALKAEKFDSGVYFRYDTIPPKRAWPARYQVNLKDGDMTNLVGVKEAKSADLTTHGEWNRMKLTVRGTHAEVEVNGKFAWKFDGLEGPKEGFIGLQAEVPAGGQYRFRNIFITELK